MINIIDFGNVEIDGVNVGDCIAASANRPNLALDILTALIAYDNSICDQRLAWADRRSE